MALVIEDGQGRADAQSYASVDYLKAYARARNASIPSSSTDCEVLLMKAMDALRGRDYQGDRVTRAQALDWPRGGVCIDGFDYAYTDLPRQLLDVQCVLAIEAQSGDLQPTLPTNARGPMTSQTVGPITTTWAESGRTDSKPVVQKAQPLLRKLLRTTGGANSIAVVRA